MFMRWQVEGQSGELRFAYSRRTTDGSERVRLLRAEVTWYDTDARRVLLQNYAQHVLSTVALPRRRTTTEATISLIAEELRRVSGVTWRCMNVHRVCRRRRAPQPRTQAYAPPSLREAQPVRRHVVYNYSYKPTPRFKVGEGEDHTVREYFGVELEIDQNQPYLETRDVPDMAQPNFYCKIDGSLDYGVELVSHPGSRKWWTEQRGNVEALLTRLSRIGWRSHETGRCGMHIHISLASFENSMHMYRFLHLMYRFPDLALLVSQRHRRSLNQWATLRYNKKPMLKYKADLRLKRTEYDNCESSGHYDGVNKTSHTFELRIFNGTLNPARFYKNMQYAYAVLDYTRDMLNLRKINPADFSAWLQAHADVYPDLVAFLAERSDSPVLKQRRTPKVPSVTRDCYGDAVQDDDFNNDSDFDDNERADI